MKCVYEFCKVNDVLKKAKLHLEEAIGNNSSKFLANEIIKLSQNLDRLVFRCVQCKIANNIKDILDINNIAGRHSMFFYYSKEHLLVCLAQYLKQAIDRNELCPVFIKPDWYETLSQYFNYIKLPAKNIQYYPVDEMIRSFRDRGLEAFKEKVLEVENWAKEQGFSGIRIVGQCSYAIELCGKSDFLKFEIAINSALSGTEVAALCVYDFYDFVNSATYIDDEILNDSFKTHTNIHLLSSYKAVCPFKK